jgi:hypothetical protein
VLKLVPGHLGAGMIEEHEPGARRALIHCPDEVRHCLSLTPFALNRSSQGKRLFTAMSEFAARLTMYIL